jgi:hypothetical protein
VVHISSAIIKALEQKQANQNTTSNAEVIAPSTVTNSHERQPSKDATQSIKTERWYINHKDEYK